MSSPHESEEEGEGSGGGEEEGGSEMAEAVREQTVKVRC